MKSPLPSKFSHVACLHSQQLDPIKGDLHRFRNFEMLSAENFAQPFKKKVRQVFPFQWLKFTRH